ncbi:hypothetical protein FGG08_000113, partial [Glutinoglossum americanum]
SAPRLAIKDLFSFTTPVSLIVSTTSTTMDRLLSISKEKAIKFSVTSPKRQKRKREAELSMTKLAPAKDPSRNSIAKWSFVGADDGGAETLSSSIGRQPSIPLADEPPSIEDVWMAYVTTGGYTPDRGWLTYKKYHTITASEPDTTKLPDLIRETENKANGTIRLAATLEKTAIAFIQGFQEFLSRLQVHKQVLLSEIISSIRYARRLRSGSGAGGGRVQSDKEP